MGMRRRIVRDRRGAVLAEFIVAFMPICAMFLCTAQLSRYAIARLAVTHAAEVSARACAVIIDPMPGHEKELDGKDSEVQDAAHIAIKPFGGTDFGGQEIKIEDPTCEHTGDSNGGTDTVKINATYHCMIPLAHNIVCSTGDKTWTEQVSFPHQGADYHLTEEGD